METATRNRSFATASGGKKRTAKFSAPGKRRHAPETANASVTWKTLLKQVAISGGFGSGLYFLLLLPASFAALTLDVAPRYLPLIAIPLAALCTLLAAYGAVRPARKHGFAVGLLVAVCVYLVLLLISWLIQRQTLGINAVLLLITTLISGGLGGVLAVSRS
jgi:putative membrane protein (TIGR04086 family)